MHVTDNDRRLIESRGVIDYLPRLLLYPFDIQCLLTLAALALSAWLATAHVLGLTLLIFTIAAFLQFQLAVLHKTSLGDGDAPLLGGDDLRFRSVLFKLLLIVAAVTGVMLLGYQHSHILGQGLSLLIALTLPAIILLLSLEQSLLLSLHPVRIWEVIKGGGSAYLLMCVILGLAWFLAGRLFMRNTILPDSSFVVPTGVFLLGYITVLSMHLLGYVAYHRHRQIGLRVFKNRDTILQQDGEDDATLRHRAIDEMDALVRADNIEAARAALERCTRALFADEQLEWLDEILARNIYPLDLFQARRSILALLDSKRSGDAVMQTMRMLTRYEKFIMAGADDWLRICRAALEIQRHDFFERLAIEVPTKYPGAPENLDIALLLANHYVDRRNDPERALALLLPYRDWHTHPKARQLAALIDILKS